MRYVLPILLLGAFMLSACAGPAAKSRSYLPPDTPGGRMCTSQCGAAKDSCQQICDLNQRQCIGTVQTRALLDYEQYSREQFANHARPELRPRDFERTEPCDASRKNCTDTCEDHYQQCYENCGGTVNVTTSCQFLCF